MGMQEDLRKQLIRQFASEVVETTDSTGEMYYSCPSCHRPVALNQDKCITCNQVLSWENVRKDARRSGVKIGKVEFELPLEFTKGNCRKCPLSYISKNAGENVYECPLGMRHACKIEIVQ